MKDNSIQAQSLPAHWVSYRSEGRLLILGPAASVSKALDLLPAGLKAEVILTEPADQSLAKRLLTHGILYSLQTEPVKLGGYLGSFQIESMSRQPEARYDLILDLQDQPSISWAVPPLGYCATRDIAEGLDSLACLVGEFDKPQYFEFKPDLCAHGNHHIEACRACLDVCRTGAIRSVDLKIEVNPYLCQGLGDCSTVCPAGAISYVYPRRKEHMDRLKRMLEALPGSQAGAWESGAPPGLLLHTGDAPSIQGFLSYPLESLSSFGMELWLCALAYGFSKVILLDRGELDQTRLSALNQQINYAREILESLGYDPDCIQYCQSLEPIPYWEKESASIPGAVTFAENQIHRRDEFIRPGRLKPPLQNRKLDRAAYKPADFEPVDDKRQALELALMHLFDQASIQPEFVELSPQAPFGEIGVKGSGCTLCLSCVSVCPEKALIDGGDSPKLEFIESRCVQCGLCEKACPEKVIKLKPRYLFDRRSAANPRLLHEADVFCCIACSKPFANPQMIEVISLKLKDHPMFQGEKSRRLRMCETCRVKDLISAG